MTLDLNDADQRALLTSLVRQIVDKTVGETPGFTAQFATIASVDRDPSTALPTAQVVFDGDSASSGSHPVSVVDPDLAPGDRALILFIPPHGAIALAKAGRVSSAAAARLVWSADSPENEIVHISGARTVYPFDCYELWENANVLRPVLSAEPYVECLRSGLYSASGVGWLGPELISNTANPTPYPRVNIDVYDNSDSYTKTVAVSAWADLIETTPSCGDGECAIELPLNPATSVFYAAAGARLRLTLSESATYPGDISLLSGPVDSTGTPDASHLDVVWVGGGDGETCGSG